MQESVTRYGDALQRSQGVPVQIRVGLNSVEVVVRAIGSDLHMDYTAVGQTTHLAARMEQMAKPGSILITTETLRLAEGYVRATPLGPVPIKGLDAPVEVFELVGASGIRRRLQATAARGLTRFVGRDTELAVLVQALERAGAGHGQVVAVVGEAGVGKSRLAYKFLHSHHTQGWRVLESASVSYGKATLYFPVLDLLRRYAHVDERDDARTIRAKVTGQLLTLDEALQDAIAPLLALLEALPDDSPFLTLDPPQRRQRTLAALKRVLLRESQVQPVLVVFEDLHWIDTETQALLDSLVESLPTTRRLLLVNYRPEYQHGWGSKTYYAQLRLDPLPPASADALLQALLGDNPGLEALKPLLIARSAGNPFFLEESVRTGRGVLVGERGSLARPSPRCRCRPRFRRCWRRASTACHPRRNTSSRPPRSLAPRCPSACSRPLLSCPKPRCMAAWRTSRRPSFSTRRASFPSASTPLSTPSRTRSPTAVSSRSGVGYCTPASSRPWRRSPGTTGRWLAGARAGRAPSPPCPARRGVGQGPGVLPAGRGEGHGTVGLPRGGGVLRAGPQRPPASAGDAHHA